MSDDTEGTEGTVTVLDCDWCGKARHQVEKLIVSSGHSICNECVDLCHDVLNKERKKNNKKVEEIETLNPVQIKEYLDQYVIGQFDAKQTLSVAVVNHYKRINNQPEDLELEKSNILMLGPTGSGKTLLAKTIAKWLHVPFAIADATTLTEAGYVGEDVESIIGSLLSQADGDVNKAEHGIIFIDEIDKICRKSENTSITRDVSGEGVQQALLKLVEGTVCRVPPQGSKKHPNGEYVKVDTTNILFIASGAFVGLDKLLAEREAPKSIGFGAALGDNKEKNSLAKVEPRDIVHYGLIPEFIGRFPMITTIAELTEDQLVQILKETKNSIIDQAKYFFMIDGVELEFEEDALTAIAKKALKMETGARGLKNIVDKALLPWQFELITLKDAGVKKITITKEVIANNADPVLLYNSNGEAKA